MQLVGVFACRYNQAHHVPQIYYLTQTDSKTIQFWNMSTEGTAMGGRLPEPSTFNRTASPVISDKKGEPQRVLFACHEPTEVTRLDDDDGGNDDLMCYKPDPPDASTRAWAGKKGDDCLPAGF